MDKEAIANLIEHHRLDCMRMMYGQCSTRRCLVRGGWGAGDGSGYSKATCEALETCRALETLEAQLDGHALSAKQATDNLIRATAAEARAEKMKEALGVLKRYWKNNVWQGVYWEDQDAINAAFAAPPLSVHGGRNERRGAR